MSAVATFADAVRLLGGTPLGSGSDAVELTGTSTAANPRPGTVSFMTSWAPGSADVVHGHPRTLWIVPEGADLPAGTTNAVRVGRPRLGFALVVRDLLADEVEPVVAPTAYVDPEAQVHPTASVGHFAVLEAGVEIGPYTRVDHHVVLKTGVRIGAHCRVGAHTSIGGPGFGFETDEDGTPVRIGHRGGVVVGDHVEIGHHVSIAQGTIEPTRLADHVKVDDCVFLAHNVQVGEGSFVIAGAEVSGSVTIGRNVWIAPEVTVLNKVTIADDALVGIGAVVVKDVPANTVVAGVPAKPRGERYPGRTPTDGP